LIAAVISSILIFVPFAVEYGGFSELNAAMRLQ
jgi:hypothetical protein